MEIKDLKSNQGNIDLVVTIVTKDSPRSFNKFGKSGKVCNSKIRDDSGETVLTLWNDDVDKVEIGDKVHIQNGWCSEYKGEKQVSTGKFGKLEILEKTAAAQATGIGGVFTNDPEILAPSAAPEESTEEELDVSEEEVEE